MLEAGAPRSDALVESAFPMTGGMWRIGVTGPPGAGKSTLVDTLVRELSEGGSRVAVLAVDPSSPFTGGALLGDRIRMQAAAARPDVFIRSLASRGALGGIATMVPRALLLLDAAGYEYGIVETVGTGQSEIEVATTTDCTVLVLMPGAGDLVQAFKAGVAEVADVFVVCKSDVDGAKRTVQELRSRLSLDARPTTPVLPVSALRGDGVRELLSELDRFRQDSQRGGRAALRRRGQLIEETNRLLTEHVRVELLTRIGAERIEAAGDDLLARRLSPTELARRLLDERV
jgi:LAO/AO transport system kinase